MTDEQIINVIKTMNRKEFTVLDFSDALTIYDKSEWENLRGKYDGSSSYSILNYLSQQLVNYSRKKDSILESHVSYTEDNWRCFRKVTDEEKKYFRSNNIAVFRCVG